jgi:2-oxoglutarate ferredoxin oxidoreductase subunit alpha
VEDAFYTAIEAVNMARKYNVPVFVLSDQAIATRIEAFLEPDLEKVCQDISPDFSAVADYKPYDLDAPDGIVPRIVPGTPIASGKYPVATGLEHDEYGHPTGSPKLHMQMTAKRRKKLQALAASLPVPKVYGPPEGNVLLIGWGSTKGPIQEAVDRARSAGDSVSSLHLKHLNPLPPGLENIFSGFNTIRVVEMNDEGLYGYGQLAGLLRARFCNSKIRGLNKTDGLNWKVKDILERARQDIATGMSKL